MRYVLDCSVAVKLFVPEVGSDLADRCLMQQQAGQISFMAPDVLVAELGHTLRKHVLGAAITPEDADSALAEFLSMDILLLPAASLARQAFALALAHTGTFYDALYVALAEQHDIKVLTADDHMVNAFSRVNRTLPLRSFPL